MRALKANLSATVSAFVGRVGSCIHVSGGSRGLGFATAQGLAADGFDLALIAKDPQRLESAHQSLLSEFAATQTGLTITTHAVDLEDQVATRNMATQISETLATPKVLVLAHGVMSEKMSKTLRTTCRMESRSKH